MCCITYTIIVYYFDEFFKENPMQIMLTISQYAMPVIIGYIVLYGLIKKVPVYESFITGVKDGFKIVFDLMPTLVGLLVAVGIFRSSGFLDKMCELISPVTDALHINAALLPVALIRMFSSSAATGMVLDIFKTYGPDSLVGNTVSILMSSTETIFYTMSVYFLAVGVNKSRWTLAGALISSFASFVVSVIIGGMI